MHETAITNGCHHRYTVEVRRCIASLVVLGDFGVVVLAVVVSDSRMYGHVLRYVLTRYCLCFNQGVLSVDSRCCLV